MKRFDSKLTTKGSTVTAHKQLNRFIDLLVYCTHKKEQLTLEDRRLDDVLRWLKELREYREDNEPTVINLNVMLDGEKIHTSIVNK
jgi:hypothetical protein